MNDLSDPTLVQNSTAPDESDQTQTDETPVNNPCFHIVGVGASAGGLDPLELFFKSMPVDSGMAFVVVQHLSPDFKSQMEQLLGRKTTMPITRVKDGDIIRPNNIYLIPPRKIMVISNGALLLTDKDPDNLVSHPIDEFFTSLANDIGRHAIAIVLSGTGADGSRGIVNVAKAGGLVLCQDEETAAFDGMPLSALATGVVSMALPPDAMPALLVRYVNEALTPELLQDQDVVPDETGLQEIFPLLKERFKIDFAQYKASTVSRRIMRRLLFTDHPDIESYIKALHTNADELELLYKDLLIGVTRFFRDGEMFNVLEQQVIPALIAAQKDKDSPIRVWVAACATGEEAYSIAILLHEQLTEAGKPFDIKIFATDVHQDSVKRAGIGVYSEESLQGISNNRKERYFNRIKDGYVVNPELRRVVSFATHNLLTDAPFTKIDLISCRNLLIYLQSQIQKKLLSLFHFSLNSNGVLALGTSETLGDLSSEFEEINARFRIYRKRRNIRLPAASRFEFRNTHLLPISMGHKSAAGLENGGREKTLFPVYDRLLHQFMPPAFLLDENYCIVHIFGGGEKYLRLKSGRTSVYFLDLVSEDVKTSFAGALNHVVQKDTTVNYTGIKMKDADGELRTHRVSVQPIYDQRSKSNYFFIEISEEQKVKRVPEGESINLDSVTRKHIDSLESELRYTQENLQATIEELETANEEMQASNEELVASNEELQSTNEELQSVNEELYTVNHEYQKKIAELTEANDDMDNLLATTRVGVIFLDEELHIRRYTPAISRVFNLLPQDVGRSISGFAHTLKYTKLLSELERVIKNGVEFEAEIEDNTGTPYIMRLLPYHSTKTKKITGVLLTLIDITLLKGVEGEVERFKTISDLTGDGHALITEAGKFDYINPAFCDLLQYSPEKLSTMTFIDAVADINASGFKQIFSDALTEKTQLLEVYFLRKDGKKIPGEISLTPVSFNQEQSLLFISARDISERKKVQEELTLRNRALECARNGIVIINNSPEKEIVYVNPSFCKITEFSEDDIVGQSYARLEGEETDKDKILHLNQALEKEKDIRIQLINYKKNGEPFWNDLQVSPVASPNGKVNNFIAVITDVTASRMAQEQTKQDAQKINLLLNSTAEGIYFVDKAKRCIVCNNSAAKLLGYSGPEDLIGNNIHELIHHTKADGSPYPKEECLINRSIREGEPITSDEELFWRKDGTSMPIEYWSHPVRDENGVVEGSVVTFFDITQRKRNHEKLMQMQETAQQANNAKTTFLANMSHELRTPLAAIIGYTELLENEVTGKASTEKIDVLKRNSTHLLELLNDLLDLSKIESGNLAIYTEECELVDILADLQAIYHAKAKEKKLNLKFDVLESVPARLVTDPVRCRQVISNLINNAIKYTKKGSVTVTVQPTEVEQKPYLQIAVTDTGEGIKPAERSKLFEPFFRGSSRAVSKTGGSGLGLSISHRLASQLGGYLEYDSTPGVGSQFRFALPARPVQVKKILKPGPVRRRQTESLKSILPELKLNILIVDDNEDIRVYLADLLKSCQAITTVVEDGREALDYINDNKNSKAQVDLILMDVHMPNMNGYQTVAALRQQGFTKPVIAITAGAMKGERQKCLMAGFDEYLSKPIDVDLLFRKIQRLQTREPSSRMNPVTAKRPSPEGDRTKILIVDDSVDLIMATKELLTLQGYEVITVFDGQSAIDAYKTYQPELVLLDLGLPDLDGISVLKQIKEKHTTDKTVFIALTGYGDKEIEQEALRAGFNNFLIKPITLADLMATLEDS